MKTNRLLADLSERQLLDRFGDLVRQDRASTAQLLAHIAEIDERKLWAKHACSSMFAFCMERFHMSESMTAKRISAARTARRFPVILPMVARGELHLSGINQLGKHLTPDNHRTLLARAKHKSSREIDVLVAEVAPTGGREASSPDAPSLSICPAAAVCRAVTVCRAATVCRPESAAHVSKALAGASKPAAACKQIVALAPRRFKIEITVDQNTHDRLRSLQDLLSHQWPNPDPAIIVSRAIELLLEDTLKKKAAVTNAARPSGGPSGRPGGRPSGRPSGARSRAIPAAIRREVWMRDVGRCAFVDERGRRCRATSRIEYHHEIPYGKGGRHDVKNIALRCRGHNQYQADLDFGRELMRSERRSAVW